MNHFQSTLLAILSISTVILLFNMFLPGTSNQLLTLEVKQVINNKATELALNKSSLELLTKVTQNKQDLLIVIEKQRTMFLGIIGLLATLLAFIGVYGVIQRLVEKSEQEDLRSLLNEYQIELQKLKEFELSSKIASAIQFFEEDRDLSHNYGEEGYKPVNDLASYIQTLTRFTTAIVNTYKESYEPSNFIENIALDISNYTREAVIYGFKKEYIDNQKQSISKNEIFRCIISQFKESLSPVDFVTFKETYIHHYPQAKFDSTD